ncbi:hypothetical protein BCR34DRAFT_336025 [Clohesyomyces aquaticus]|uniref:Uncharacterized protein n=1 Tax=Clohesyomyces aquaticus TaxID=1231657 RepID=A0A1Y1ZL39_9PLEO|nr:hypothetical protein BCR34DRAFT_336025 [Clohesyomyces aquaticus]
MRFGTFGRIHGTCRPREARKNSVLRLFSQVLVDCGLVDSIGDADVIVIPPFANLGLLPTKMGYVSFDELPEESSSDPEDQIDDTISTKLVRGQNSDQSKQTKASGSGSIQETINNKDKSGSRLEGTTKAELQTTTTELANLEEGQALKEKEDTASHTSQLQRSATAGEEDGNG